MANTGTTSGVVEKLVGEACARNTPAELHYESTNGIIVTARLRLLHLTNDQILADRPVYFDDKSTIPPGHRITVHLSLLGSRYQFDSVIEDANQLVHLTESQWVPGIALRKPISIAESQRRSCLRISLAGYDPINANLVRPSPETSTACPVDAELIAGRLVNLSIGGAAILVDMSVVRNIRRNEKFYLTFALPDLDDEFCMFGSVRHARVIKDGDSLRLGFSFEPWYQRRLINDQHRIARFIAAHERRTLRRRR